MGKRYQRALENRKNQARGRRNLILTFFFLLAMGAALFFLSGIKERLFPGWVVENWSRLMAVLLVAAIVAVLAWSMRQMGVVKSNGVFAGPGGVPSGAEVGYSGDGSADLGGCDAGGASGGDGSCD